MPIPVNIDKAPQELVWYFNPNENRNNSTASSYGFRNDKTNSIFNSDVMNSHDFNQLFTQNNISNKQFIKFENLLSKQYKNFSNLYINLPLEKIKELTSGVVSFLLSFSPDCFSLELTGEESIFYTLKKDGLSYYIHQFFETEDDGFNATLVVFNGDQKIESINGNINTLLNNIERQIILS